MSTQSHETTQIPSKSEMRLSRRALLGRAAALTGGAIVGANMLGTSRAFAQDAAPMAADAMPMTSAVPSTLAATMAVPSATAENPFGDLVNLSSDLDILNFALILEYLEAEFYARVVAANAARPFLRERAPFVAQKLANDEAAHVSAIIEQIVKAGGTPVAKPNFQFPDNVFISQTGFLTLATALEETGVGAYLGAAPKIKSRPYLQFAASIYGIEARHTGLIRLISGRTSAPDALEAPLTAQQVVARALPYIVTS